MGFPFNAMNQWYQGQPGASLRTLECHQVESLLAKISGDALLQIGRLSDAPYFSSNTIEYQLDLGTDVIADPYELPFFPDTLDVVVLAHGLEFADHPVQLLEEIYRILAPNGYLIILGFNPWSLWGWAKLFKNKKKFPWCGKFWSRAHIKQWCRNLDYSIVSSKTLCFRTPMAKASHRKLTWFLEALGQFCFPAFGGVYSVMVQKKVYEPLKRKTIVWKKRTLVRRGLVEPTVR